VTSGSPDHRADASRDGDGDEKAAGPTLEVMRTVWLAMREEEPPERGLTALLTAARDQAAVARPTQTRWRRLRTGLRRPPSLAFAAVVVVLGGAGLVTRRMDRVAMPAASVSSGVAAPAAESSPPGASAAGAGAGGASLAPASTAGTRLKEIPEPGHEVRVELGADRPDARPSDASLLHTPVPGALATAPGAAVGSTHVTAVESSAASRDVREETAASSAGDGRVPRSLPRDRAEIRSPQAPRPSAQIGIKMVAKADAPAADHGLSPPPPAAGTTTRDGRRGGLSRGQAGNADALPRIPALDNADAPEGAPASPVGQLRQQCESAARRGDCESVRRIMGRITAIDHDAPAQLAKKAAVARCLAETAE
jgi:hypothetical protein